MHRYLRGAHTRIARYRLDCAMSIDYNPSKCAEGIKLNEWEFTAEVASWINETLRMTAQGSTLCDLSNNRCTKLTFVQSGHVEREPTF